MDALDPKPPVILPNLCFKFFLRPKTASYKVLKNHKAGFHDHTFRWFYTMSIEKCFIYLSKQQGGIL